MIPSRSPEGLLSPLSLGGLTLRNRFVMAPMTREHSPDGVPGADVAAYYRRRAAGGVGLIITEGTYVDHPTAVELAAAPRMFGSSAASGWASVVHDVHADGAAIMTQLWHAGAERRPGSALFAHAPSLSPSGLSLEGEQIAAPITESQMAELIDAYVRSAVLAQSLGFDGVEIHGAHGYLLDEFFWERTNRRTDAYGGDARARSRFAAEVVRAVRSAVGADYPISFRLSQWKLRNYDARSFVSPVDLEQSLAPLADAGVTVFHVSTRRHYEPGFPDSPLGLAGWVKRVTGRPTITVGSVGLRSAYSVANAGGTSERSDLAALLRQFDDQEFDLVAVGRALLHDPEWVAKIRDGRESEIRDFDPRALDRLI